MPEDTVRTTPSPLTCECCGTSARLAVTPIFDPKANRQVRVYACSDCGHLTWAERQDAPL
ncbi:hypothetical protein [Bradyrhizobium sp. STM 3557]|uniref:hypothetical protein n=1 Tax=Bradyrhizobium sp. STM 3557 TaxID=578920 RepID=UPI00388DA8B7